MGKQPVVASINGYELLKERNSINSENFNVEIRLLNCGRYFCSTKFKNVGESKIEALNAVLTKQCEENLLAERLCDTMPLVSMLVLMENAVR